MMIECRFAVSWLGGIGLIIKRSWVRLGEIAICCLLHGSVCLWTTKVNSGFYFLGKIEHRSAWLGLRRGTFTCV